MALQILTFVLGPLDNNTYLLTDTDSGEAAIIDPAGGSESILAEARRAGSRLKAIWMTHAHFDHLTGVSAVAEAFTPPLPVLLHPADLDLWNTGGGAWMFGVPLSRLPQPAAGLTHGQALQLGSCRIEVRHAPGHTPGHVVFYAAQAQAAFVGDVIFRGSIGRTDLPGGNHATLIDSIRTQVLTLSPQTRLLSGHGPETTVEEERRNNPFLQD